MSDADACDRALNAHKIYEGKQEKLMTCNFPTTFRLPNVIKALTEDCIFNMTQTGSYGNKELYTSVCSHAHSVFGLTLTQTRCRYRGSAKKTKKQKNTWLKCDKLWNRKSCRQRTGNTLRSYVHMTFYLFAYRAGTCSHISTGHLRHM